MYFNVLMTDSPYSLGSLNLCESSWLHGVTCNMEKKDKIHDCIFVSCM